MKDKRGFTLIELIVVLGLAGIVITVVMSFFIVNYKNYETINTESELQYQSQYIINFMTNKILEATDYEGNVLGKETFKYENGSNITFEVVDNELIFNDSVDSVGDYVKELKIEETAGNDNEILITLTLEKGKQNIVAEQTVYMRNSK